jgi:transposase
MFHIVVVRQRTSIKFCLKLGKTFSETHEILVWVYGDAAVSRKTVYKWLERFRGGAESTEEEPRRLLQQMKTCRKSTK